MTELRAGHYAEGESLLRKALTMVEDSPAKTPIQVAAYETNLALALELTGRYPEARIMLEHVTRTFEANPAIDPEHVAAALTELSAAEIAAGKFGLAEDHALRAVAVLPAPYTRVNLAMVYLDEGKTSDAAQILPGLVAELRAAGADTRTLGDSLRTLARLRASERKWSQAASLYREAISVYQSAFGPNHPEVARLRREYASVTKHHVPGGSDA